MHRSFSAMPDNRYLMLIEKPLCANGAKKLFQRDVKVSHVPWYCQQGVAVSVHRQS